MGVTPGSSVQLQLTSDTKSRFYFFVPPGYTQSSPIGMVMAFHGVEGTMNPSGFFTVCVSYANLDRFIVVSPVGDTADGGSGAWSQPYGREIMNAVRGAYNIDNSRQYVAAISGGCYPAIWFALCSAPATYSNFQGQTVQSGFQADFAAVGFTAPAYSPSMGYFASMTSQSASGLGFTPGMWADYGSASSDGPRASDLASWATARGYTPVNLVVRPGEGHPPAPPYDFVKQMFDMFAANPKP